MTQIFNQKTSSWDKLNKIAQDIFSKTGFATLESEDAERLVDLNRADEIALETRGEISFLSLPEEDMKKIINRHPELIKRS